MEVEAKRLDNGDLELTCDPESRAELREALAGSGGYWGAFAELFESHSCNGSFTPFDAGEGNPFVGLTSAPCIAESMDYPDNGDSVIAGDFWHFGDYMIRDPLEELCESGRTVFTLARESES